MQSKGRTRMRGSVYYELVEEGTQDERQANKSGGAASLHVQQLQSLRTGSCGQAAVSHLLVD